MAELVIRDVDESVLSRLAAQAERNKHTLEDEVKSILTHATRMSVEEFRKRALEITREIREKTKHIPQTDSTILIREDRDR